MSTQSNTQTITPEAVSAVPIHLGLVLDGNRRWAKDHNLPIFEGHRRGYENFKVVGQAALKRGVKYLTAYVFSTENWKRSEEEVNFLMNLFYWVATHEVNELHSNNVRLRFIGRPEGLSKRLLDAINAAERKTKKNSGGTLALCLNYGGHQEIIDAASKIISEGIDPSKITPQIFAKYLYSPDVPSLDLIVRTSGEHRTSGFMMWRSDYAELLFVDKYWPDFTVEDLDGALAEYASRQRRFGK